MEDSIMFKLLILDIDGVLTDGTKTYDLDGNVLSKTFHDHDFTAIKMLRKINIDVCFLSGDRRVNENMAKNRNIKFFHNEKGADKSVYLEGICSQYSVTKEEAGYIGDDVYDLSILKMVKYPMCPEDAVRDVTELCEEDGYVIPCKGGRGVVKNLYYENQWFLKASWKK